MYAARKLYVKQWDFQKPSERYSVTLTKGGEPIPRIAPEKISVVTEEVMTWRKANHIHRWFVENVQDGNDDCGEYGVSQKHLERLLAACEQVLKDSELIEGKVYAGTKFDPDHPDGIDMLDPGKVIKDPAVAAGLLPTQSGFFFGGVGYDQYYLEDVQDTRDWIVRMLADAKNGVPADITYRSSW